VFASEIHDSLARLAFMRMRMSLLQDAIRAGNGAQSLRYFRDIQDSRRGPRGLREPSPIPPALDRRACCTLETTRAPSGPHRVDLRIENRARDLRLPAEQESQVYQIVREALANVIKHAGASNARVVLERTAKSFRVSVEDDGSGARIARSRPGTGNGEHYGLEIMRERARRIGGRLRIVSAPGKGTQVCLSIPQSPAITD
jgi:two-component system nitrate/nitrite sensor histidine kinase NarX